jgi:hypothetical protein
LKSSLLALSQTVTFAKHLKLRANGAPWSTKMGNIRSPWRYDAGAYDAINPERIRLPAIARCASWAAVIR